MAEFPTYSTLPARRSRWPYTDLRTFSLTPGLTAQYRAPRILPRAERCGTALSHPDVRWHGVRRRLTWRRTVRRKMEVVLDSSESAEQPAILANQARMIDSADLGFETLPNKVAPYTTSTAILIRNSEVLEFDAGCLGGIKLSRGLTQPV